MATTKSRTTKPTTRTRTTAKKKTAVSRRTTTEPVAESFTTRTTRSIKDHPVKSAAIASGVAAIVGGIAAGAYMLRKSDRTLGEITSDTRKRVKDGLGEASEFVGRKYDGLKESSGEAYDSLKTKTGNFIDHIRGEEEAAQEDIAEEAMTLKQLNKSSRRKAKVGSVAY